MVVCWTVIWEEVKNLHLSILISSGKIASANWASSLYLRRSWIPSTSFRHAGLKLSTIVPPYSVLDFAVWKPSGIDRATAKIPVKCPNEKCGKPVFEGTIDFPRWVCPFTGHVAVRLRTVYRSKKVVASWRLRTDPDPSPENASLIRSYAPSVGAGK